MIPIGVSNKKTFVFPTEVSARFWRDWSARSSAVHAVRSDRFISWDSFADQVLDTVAGSRKADSFTRRVSARIILDRVQAGRGKTLNYLIPPEFHSEAGQFYRMITALLPKLGDLVHRDGTDALGEDLRWLHRQYCEILSSSSCYEPSFLQHEAFSAPAGDAEYVIYFPELITGFDCLLGQLEKSPRVQMVPAGTFPEMTQKDPGKLKIYRNSSAELSALVDWIEKQLLAGVHPSDICITLGDYDSWRIPLEEECAVRGIPVIFRQGGKLGSYPAGRFFQDLLAAASGGWSLANVKRLLLNRGYPWKEAGSLSRIAEAGMKHRCMRNPPGEDVWEKALLQEGNRELLQLWRRFSSHVRRITGEREPNRLRESLFGFLDIWMDRELRGEDEFARVFDYCLQQGSSFLEACEYIGMETCDGLYPLWLQALQDSRYVPQTADEGVQVFPYGLSAGIFPMYHGISGLSQEEVIMRSGEIPFFSDTAARHLGLQVDDRTEEYLSLCGGEHLRLSCSEETFTGPAMAPSRFSGEGRVEHEEYDGSSNLYQTEVHWWALNPGSDSPASAWYPLQKLGYEYALGSMFAPRETDLFEKALDPEDPWFSRLLDKTAYKRVPGIVRVSPYSLDSFTRCRFEWVFSSMLSIEEFNPSPGFADSREEGTLLHDCLQDFFSEGIGIGGAFNSGELPWYLDMMELSLDRTLRNAEAKYAWMIPGMRRQYENQFSTMLSRFLEFEAEHFDGWICGDLELYLEVRNEEKGYAASGRVDRISVAPEGDGYGIIDYKRSRPQSGGGYSAQDNPPPSYQLPFYAWLIDDLRADGLVPKTAFFYAMRDGRAVPAFDSIRAFPRSSNRIQDLETFEKLTADTKEAVENMAASVRLGDFSGPDSRKRCAGCRNRMLCRRRYHVR